MTLTNAQVQEAFQRLGVDPMDFRRLASLATYEDRCKGLEDIKDRVHKGFKKAALEFHPDRTGDDPAKTEVFKLLSQVVDEVDKLVVKPPAVPTFHTLHFSGSSTAATSTTTSATMGAWHVRIVVR